MQAAWIISRLGKRHDRSQFDCGNKQLTEWLRQYAGQFDRRDLSRTFVACGAGSDAVIGYYSLSNRLVDVTAIPPESARKLPPIDIPVVLLGRLAVDRSAQGQGLGAHLLLDALRRVEHVAQHTGVRAVEVDAIDEAARNFYVKYGFRSLADDQRHMYLPLQAIRELRLPPLAP